MEVLYAGTEEMVMVLDQKTLSSLGKFVVPKVDKKSASCTTLFKVLDNHVITVKGQHICAYSFSKEQPFRRSILQDIFTAFEATVDDKFYFAGATNGSVYVWDVATGDCLRIFDAHLRKVTHLKATGNFLISCGDDAVVHIWNLADLLDEQVDHVEPCRSMNEHSMPITGLYCEPASSVCEEARIYTCSEDKTLKVTDLSLGECILTILLPEPASSLAVCPSKVYIGLLTGDIVAVNMVSLAFDSKLTGDRVLTLDKIEEHTEIMRFHKTKVVSMCFCMTAEKLFSADSSGKIAIWDLESSQAVKSFDCGVPIFALHSGLKKVNLFMQVKNAPAAISPALSRTVVGTSEGSKLCEFELTQTDTKLNEYFATHSTETMQASINSKEDALAKENEELKTKYENLCGLYSKMTKLAGLALSQSLEENLDR